MGRHRKIDREAVLDAAERVVSREGAAHLTLEAVAIESRISKGSVLYDYKTKRGLIRAIIERRVAAEEARVQAFVDEVGQPNAHIRGKLAAASRSLSDQDRTVALTLCAALAQDAGLREPIQRSYRDLIARITSHSSQPRGAMLAFLAIEGMLLMERFGLHSWTEGEREGLIAELGWLVEQYPAAASSSLPQEA